MDTAKYCVYETVKRSALQATYSLASVQDDLWNGRLGEYSTMRLEMNTCVKWSRSVLEINVARGEIEKPSSANPVLKMRKGRKGNWQTPWKRNFVWRKGYGLSISKAFSMQKKRTGAVINRFKSGFIGLQPIANGAAVPRVARDPGCPKGYSPS